MLKIGNDPQLPCLKIQSFQIKYTKSEIELINEKKEMCFCVSIRIRDEMCVNEGIFA